jgi:mannose-1-phosphate guanylyltransferase
LNAVVLVGGGGTRLRPLTYAVPKPLIPVVNRPLILHLLDNLRRHGVRHAVLAASASDKRIEQALGDGSAHGLSLSYSYETRPLGSGLAVKQAARNFDSAFFVCNGDVITDLDLSAMASCHREHAAILSISLGAVEDPSAFGVAELGAGDQIVRFIEKPPRAEAPSNWANAGTWIFEPEVLDYIPEERMDRSLEQLVFPALIGEGLRVQGFTSTAYWMDVGTSERYLQLHRDLLDGRMPACLEHARNEVAGAASTGVEVVANVIIGPKCQIGSGARISGPSVLGVACVIGDKASVSGSVLWGGVAVGTQATVRDSILGEGCVIGEDAIVEGAVLANGARVGDGVRLGPGARLEPGETAL